MYNCCLYDLSKKSYSNIGTQTIEISGQLYTWCGGFGAILKSKEYGIKKDSIRMICDIPFIAYRIESYWLKKPEICWTIPYRELDVEWIREFRKKIFC